MILYRILLAIDAITAAILLWFFVVGVGDGSVDSFNILSWIIIIAGLAAVIGGGMALQARGQRVAAAVLLTLLAAPALLVAFLLLVMIGSNPRWN